MTIELIKGVAFMLALSQLISINLRLWRNRRTLQKISSGLVFGLICIVGMMMPIQFSPGVIFDARSAVLGMAGLFGGPLVGGLAALLASVYRLWLGGSGAAVGVSVIVISVLMGLAYRFGHQRGQLRLDLAHLLLFGGLLHLMVLLLFMQLPTAVATAIIERLALPLVLVFIPATALLGLLLRDVNSRFETESELSKREAQLRATVNAIPDLLLVVDEDGRCVEILSREAALQQASRQPEVGMHLDDFLPEQEAARLLRLVRRALKNQRAEVLEYALQTPLGTRQFEGHVQPLGQQTGQRRTVLILAHDITELKQTAHQLLAEKNRSMNYLDTVEALIISLDLRGTIMMINRKGCELLGYPAQELIGKDWFNMALPPEDTEKVRQVMRLMLDGRMEPVEYFENHIVTRSGERRLIAWHNNVLLDEQGQISGTLSAGEDITERRAAEEKIRHLAFYDSLTGLPNRRLLTDRLQHAINLSGRSTQHCALLFIDLDHFKTLNDTLGHETGDQLLQEVARRLCAVVREGDTVARLGGDEYVVVLENLSSSAQEAATQTQVISGKLLDALYQPYTLGGHEHHSSASIGATLFDGQASSIEELLKQADLAMYQAKSTGRNSMRFFAPNMQTIVSARVKLEADLRQGIKQGQFFLHYQPQVDAVDNTLGAEVLLRWSHPERGMLPPALFIPLAEETGQILYLGQWVLETACHQLAIWAQEPQREHLTLAVNISARQFLQSDFDQQVFAILDRTGAPPHKLKLELTESMLLDNIEDAVTKMIAIRARGVTFSLDDFGTGYSSLSYLKRLPLDQIKIDQSFVRDLLIDPNDAIIAQTIITLGHSLGLNVIAEGVETEAQKALLNGQGCDAYQGYLIDRPMSLEDFLRRPIRTAD